MAAQIPHTPQPSQPLGADALRMARRVNRAWITRGNIAESTENYLKHLETHRPWEINALCEQALEKARAASRAQQDPKPPFYASIFSSATKQERNHFLRNHFFTRLLSAEMQLQRRQCEQ